MHGAALNLNIHFIHIQFLLLYCSVAFSDDNKKQFWEKRFSFSICFFFRFWLSVTWKLNWSIRIGYLEFEIGQNNRHTSKRCCRRWARASVAFIFSIDQIQIRFWLFCDLFACCEKYIRWSMLLTYQWNVCSDELGPFVISAYVSFHLSFLLLFENYS